MSDTSYEVDVYESSGTGWKLFAGIMVIIVGTFNVIDGLVVAITNADQPSRTPLVRAASCRSRTTSRRGVGSC